MLNYAPKYTKKTDPKVFGNILILCSYCVDYLCVEK